jgi:hypothetical protein
MPRKAKLVAPGQFPLEMWNGVEALVTGRMKVAFFKQFGRKDEAAGYAARIRSFVRALQAFPLAMPEAVGVLKRKRLRLAIRSEFLIAAYEVSGKLVDRIDIEEIARGNGGKY